MQTNRVYQDLTTWRCIMFTLALGIRERNPSGILRTSELRKGN